MYKHETGSTRAQGLCMHPLHLTAPSSGPESLELHVPLGRLVGLALPVNLSQARGTLSMEREVYARNAQQ